MSMEADLIDFSITKLTSVVRLTPQLHSNSVAHSTTGGTKA